MEGGSTKSIYGQVAGKKINVHCFLKSECAIFIFAKLRNDKIYWNYPQILEISDEKMNRHPRNCRNQTKKFRVCYLMTDNEIEFLAMQF
jgi:hypothetical protein